jgi:glucose-6-phosphate isomerase
LAHPETLKVVRTCKTCYDHVINGIPVIELAPGTSQEDYADMSQKIESSSLAQPLAALYERERDDTTGEPLDRPADISDFEVPIEKKLPQ